MNEEIIDDRRLGKLPAKSSMKALQLSDFVKPTDAGELPKATNFWTRRRGFPLQTFGNNQFGCCTRAKQALAAMRMERLECGRAPRITDDEIIRVYTDMSNRLYGGGDNGAYETDALSEWRKPDLTFRDTKGRPMTIDAFMRINHADPNEIKRGIHLSAAHILPVCFNLPRAFQREKARWDVPENQPLVGAYMPGTWGGHSMTLDEYNEFGVKHPTTWGTPDIWISWRAVMIYADEAHVIIDSVNSWSKKNALSKRIAEKIKDAVNEVSDQKIK